MNPAWHATSLRVPASDLVIVMDKPPLESGPREGNTESYSRSFHYLQPRREKFCKVSVVTKITKFFYYENLALYGIYK